MEDTLTTTQSVEGVSGQTPESQVAVPETQVSEQSQSAESVAVDSGQQEASSQTAERPRPSDFYRDRREMRQLKTALNDSQRQIQELASYIKSQQTPSVVQPVAKEPDADAYWSDPVGYTQKIRDQIREELRKEISESIPKTWEQMQVQDQRRRNEQDALELIFPKSANSNEALEDRIARDSAKAERIQRILVDTKLDILSREHPMEAARLALQLYDAEAKETQKKNTNPNVIKKALVGGVPSGNPNNGGKLKMATIEEIKTEIGKMDKQLEVNPNLRFDDAFKQRKEQIKAQLVELATKQ